jgi:hypothetical protein
MTRAGAPVARALAARGSRGHTGRMIRFTSACASLVALVGLLAPGLAQAKPRETYVFLISRVELGKEVPAEVEEQAATRVNAAIAAHDQLEAALAAGAPDPEAEPKKFKSYLKARRQRAFKVNVEVTVYSMAVEQASAGRGKTGQYLTVRVELRLFGETVPDRVMAFTGDGSATVKLEVGKNVRPRDREEASSAALDQAVAGAIEQSLRRLSEPPPSQKKKRKG